MSLSLRQSPSCNSLSAFSLTQYAMIEPFLPFGTAAHKHTSIFLKPLPSLILWSHSDSDFLGMNETLTRKVV